MNDDQILRRKWTLRAHDKQVVFVKRPNERASHVVMKALLWALYLPRYPDLIVEPKVDDRYRPDVASLGLDGRPCFWAEAGQVTPEKIRSLARRYRETHLAIAKWDIRQDHTLTNVHKALKGITRSAPVDVITFPADSVERFIDDEGRVQLTHDDVSWVRIG